MKRHNILIVDDTPMVLRALGDMLKNDYNVLVAKTGEAGITSAKKNKPSLILLDLMMPGMSGFDAIKIMKEDDEIKNIPVIFVSGDVSFETKELGYNLGALDFFEKPFIEVAIKRRIAFITQYLDLKSRLQAQPPRLEELTVAPVEAVSAGL